MSLVLQLMAAPGVALSDPSAASRRDNRSPRSPSETRGYSVAPLANQRPGAAARVPDRADAPLCMSWCSKDCDRTPCRYRVVRVLSQPQIAPYAVCSRADVQIEQ